MASTQSGEEVRDLGRYWLVGGRLLAKVMGGSEGATEDAGSAGSEGDTPDVSDDGGADDDVEDQKDEGKGETPPAKEKATREARYRTRARDAERERDELKTRLETLEDKDKTELERESAKAKKAETRVSLLETTNRNLALKLAFLNASSGGQNSRGRKFSAINWVDAEDVLPLAMREMKDLSVDEDGEVDDMDEVFTVAEQLAKRKPHLVRKQTVAAPSGGNVGGTSDRQGERTAEDLAKDFPALRSRGV